MFVELFSSYLRLRKWKAHPGATKREIGVVSSWMTADPANDEQLSGHEIETM